MKSLETIKRAVTWLENNWPDADVTFVTYCLDEEYPYFPEVRMPLLNAIMDRFQGHACKVTKDPGFELATQSVLCDGIVFSYYGGCEPGTVSHSFIIPADNAEIVAEVM